MSKKDALKKLENLIRTKVLICNDPRNATPEDFAEEYDWKISAQIVELYSLGASDAEIDKTISKAYGVGLDDLVKEFEPPKTLGKNS